MDLLTGNVDEDFVYLCWCFTTFPKSAQTRKQVKACETVLTSYIIAYQVSLKYLQGYKLWSAYMLSALKFTQGR